MSILLVLTVTHVKILRTLTKTRESRRRARNTNKVQVDPRNADRKVSTEAGLLKGFGVRSCKFFPFPAPGPFTGRPDPSIGPPASVVGGLKPMFEGPKSIELEPLGGQNRSVFGGSSVRRALGSCNLFSGHVPAKVLVSSGYARDWPGAHSGRCF